MAWFRTGTCNNGLVPAVALVQTTSGDGSAQHPYSTTGTADSNTTRYKTMAGGATVTLTCTPEAKAAGNNGTGVTVGYTASISPVFVIPTGAIQDSSGNYNILVGQGCTSSLTGIPSFTAASGGTVTYSWSVSGITLQSWAVYNSAEFGSTAVAVFGIGVMTNPTAHWYWSDAAGQKTVSCSARVTPPAGEGSPFTITATKTVTLVVPLNSPGVHTGRVQINNLSSTYGTGYALYAGAGNGSSNGIVFTDQVYTPTPFAVGQGAWGFVQIVTPGSFCTPAGGSEEPFPPPPATNYNGVTGLDTRCPYAGLFPADNTGHGTIDGPGIEPLSDFYDNYRVNEPYSMYVMYTPPGIDSCAVPLTRIDWNWQANDTNPGTWANWSTLIDAGTIQSTGMTFNPPPPQWSIQVTGAY